MLIAVEKCILVGLVLAAMTVVQCKLLGGVVPSNPYLISRETMTPALVTGVGTDSILRCCMHIAPWNWNYRELECHDMGYGR